MAKYDITYSCTHSGVVELFGKSSDRQNRISYLETTLCPECYAAELAAKSGGTWVEMHYGEYKNNYADCQKRDYNPETKTIKVLVIAKTPEAELKSDLKATGLPDSVITLVIDGGAEYVQQQLADATAKYPDAQGPVKERIGAIAAALAIMQAYEAKTASPETETMDENINNTNQEDTTMTNQEIIDTATSALGGAELFADSFSRTGFRALLAELTQELEAGTLPAPVKSMNELITPRLAITDEDKIQTIRDDLIHYACNRALRDFMHQLPRAAAVEMGNAIATIEHATGAIEVSIHPGITLSARAFAQKWNEANPDASPLAYTGPTVDFI